MIVYRYLNEKELRAIQNNEIQSLGRVFGDKMSNDFNYQKDIKYLHFYKEFDSMQYIREKYFECKSKDDFYFCSFDIPENLLISGKGIYHNLNFSGGLISIDEFILDAKQFESKWLIKVQKDIKREEDSTKFHEDSFNSLKKKLTTAKTIKNENDLKETFNNERKL